MGNIEAGKSANVNFLEYAFRKFTFATLSRTVFKSEVIDANHSLDKAKDALMHGKGLVVVINHFSRKDPNYATVCTVKYPPLDCIA